MKEYKVINFSNEDVFPKKRGFLAEWTLAMRAKRLEQYLNEMVADGWTVKSTAGIGFAIDVFVILERDKPGGEPTEPSQD